MKVFLCGDTAPSCSTYLCLFTILLCIYKSTPFFIKSTILRNNCGHESIPRSLLHVNKPNDLRQHVKQHQVSRPSGMMNSLRMSSIDNSAAILIRKGKLKETTALRSEMEQQGASHYINKYLSDKCSYPEGVSPPKSFFNVTASSITTLNVMPEINYKSKTGFILGMPPPEIMGGVLRDAGARGIFVSVDKRSGGVPVNDVERFTREQTRARIFTPGPIPIIYHDFVVDSVQLDQAAAMGASAVTIYPDFVPKGELKNWIQKCVENGIEAIVMVKTTQEGLDAIEAGARCLCLHSLSEEEIVDLRATLPPSSSTPPSTPYSIPYSVPSYSSFPPSSSSLPPPTPAPPQKSLVIGARLRPHNQFSMYGEIEACWLLRDHGFSFVWPSPDATYATGTGDLYGVVAAMRAKSSRLFLSPRQYLMDRKKEGATEYLGDILY